MMTPVTNNNDILHDEEDNHGHGHEIILRSLPNEDEMPSATNHPEEEEPDADDDEDEQPFSYGRWCPAWRRSRTLTAFLAAAGVGAAVGGGSAVFRAAGAGGKPSTTITSNMQVANVLAPAGFEVVGNVGDGSLCQDGNLPIARNYPYVEYHEIATADDCATKCNACVAGDFPTFVGMSHSPPFDKCLCYVSQTVPNVDLTQINSIGGCGYIRQASTISGTGPINGTLSVGGGYTCYRYVGGGSKAGKTPKAPKRG